MKKRKDITLRQANQTSQARVVKIMIVGMVVIVYVLIFMKIVFLE